MGLVRGMVMRFAIIEDGKVTNAAVSEAPLADNWIASEDAQIGDLWDGQTFHKPMLDTEDAWANIRASRNVMLVNSDWTQLPDAPVNTAAWAVYRQELRDITLQDDPFNIVWPTAPEDVS